MKREMISFEEAFAIAINSAFTLGMESVELGRSLNRVLADDVVSDIDMPPFDKALMDGYACRRADLKKGLSVVEVIPAGCVPRQTIGENVCSKIMTGAMIPPGADCVVNVENTRITAEDKIVVTDDDIPDNIARRGEDVGCGDVVLRCGTLILPQHIAVLAGAGRNRISVYKKPAVSIVTTGSELREPGDELPFGCIRNSNSYQLIGQVQRMFIEPAYLGIAADKERQLDGLIKQALTTSDVLLLSGGVSMGDYDLVPSVLKANGVKIVFDQVAMQPGKPFTFGMKDKTIVFAFPGNPVSTFLPFELVAKPCLYKLMGCNFLPKTCALVTGSRFVRKKAERKAFVPIKIENGNVYPIAYHSSGHISALTGAEGFVAFPVGITEIHKGEIVQVIFP